MLRKTKKFANRLAMNDCSAKPDTPHPHPACLQDNGSVRIGNMSPVFKIPVIPLRLKDTGKHRIGNMSPVFRL